MGRLCVTGTEWVEAKDAGQHPTVHRTAPPRSTVNSREALLCGDHEYNYKLNRMCPSDSIIWIHKGNTTNNCCGSEDDVLCIMWLKMALMTADIPLSAMWVNSSKKAVS